MNIIHLSNSIAPRWEAGGPVRLFFDYINEISLSGHLRISVIGGVNEITTNPYNPKIRYYPLKLKRIQIFGIKFFQVNWFKLFNTLIKEEPRVIVLNELRGQNVLASLLYKLIFNKKVELRSVPCGHILDTNKLTYRIHDLLVKILGGNHITYYAQNQVELYALKEKFVKCKILPLSIKFSGVKPRDGYLDSECIRIISVGRNSLLKGFSDLLELIKGIELDISFTVMSLSSGDHDFSSMDLNYLEPDFTNSRFETYKRYDIAILLPRICEQTSLGLVEFLSVGVPVIYNNNADMPHVDGVCGVMIPSNSKDPKLLKSAIEKIIFNYSEYSANARKVAYKYYNVETNVKTLFESN